MIKILQRIFTHPPTIIAKPNSSKNYKTIGNMSFDYFKPYLGQNSSLEKKALSWLLKNLKRNKGIIIGDCPHIRPHTKHFLARNLGEFKAAGVKHIYSEYFNQSNQEALDRFFVNGDNIDEIKSILSSSLGRDYAIDMLKESRRLEIKTFGIEMPNHCDSLVERNKHWSSVANIHAKELKPEEKFILFGGSAHISNDMKPDGLLKTTSGPISRTLNSDGIDSIMNLPALSTTVNYDVSVNNNRGLFKKLNPNLCFLEMPYYN